MDGFAIVMGGASGARQVYNSFQPASAHLVGVGRFTSNHCWVIFQPAYDAVLQVDSAALLDASVSALPIRKAVRVPFIAVQAPSYSALAGAKVNHTNLFQETESRLLRVLDGEPVVAYRQSQGIDEETFEDDLLLFQKADRAVMMLNKPAAFLWEALQWPHSPVDLRALLVEAGVTNSHARAAQIVASVLDDLIELEFVRPTGL